MQAPLERAQCLLTLARAFGPIGEDPARLAAGLDAWRVRARGDVADALERARSALAADPAALAEEWDRLLGGRGGVAARESSWADPRRIAPTDLADLAGFLAAFRIEARGLPPDHIAAELELASLLALKQAYALAEGWAERSEVARGAYEKLIADHLARWTVPFAARVREEAEHGFHAAAADLLELLVRREAERLGVEIGEAAPSLAEEDVGTCGSCAAP
jgi:TorA maturation chaperone TorD